jgi:hypothetical protein
MTVVTLRKPMGNGACLPSRDQDECGHGLSENPHDAYGDLKLWADDVKARWQGIQARLSGSNSLGVPQR